MYNKMKECPKCKKIKSLDNFSKNKNRVDGLARTCRPCKAEYDKKYYDKDPKSYCKKNYKYELVKKDFVIRYKKMFGKCVDCGITDWRVLEFDHIKGIKEFNISEGLKKSFQTLKKEIRKCECRCANCHRIKTRERREK